MVIIQKGMEKEDNYKLDLKSVPISRVVIYNRPDCLSK